jgi:hypothetical protein
VSTKHNEDPPPADYRPEDIVSWAEVEIEQATRRHPDAAERVQKGLPLLQLTDALMGFEEVYRSHCAELLDRVARQEDTRPATAAECVIALSDLSRQGPLNSTGISLCLRMWRLAELIP